MSKYKFGQRSLERLKTCDPRLQEIMHEVIKIIDVTILCGHRTKEDQDEAFEKGNSQLQYPNSNHNKIPSTAIDVAPYPINWEDREAFQHMAGIIKGIAHEKGIKIKWGGDFESLFDAPHIELDD